MFILIINYQILYNIQPINLVIGVELKNVTPCVQTFLLFICTYNW